MNILMAVVFLAGAWFVLMTTEVHLLQNVEMCDVVVTITTCKRLSLFKQTMKSFFHVLQDKGRICYVLVVDDNSSTEDRQAMKELYPHFRYIFKDHSEKGHAKSLNMIQQYTTLHGNVSYAFHLEDDWLFEPDFKLRLGHLIDILQQEPRAGQVLINEVYAEIHNHSILTLGPIKAGPSPYRYSEHVYLREPAYGAHLRSLKSNELTTAFWPHYSLRPGLLKTSVWHSVGLYNETHQQFEHDYALRYVKKGFSTLYLEGVHSLHLGKRTWEAEEDVPSAYALNGETRFAQ